MLSHVHCLVARLQDVILYTLYMLFFMLMVPSLLEYPKTGPKSCSELH